MDADIRSARRIVGQIRHEVEQCGEPGRDNSRVEGFLFNAWLDTPSVTDALKIYLADVKRA